MFKNIILFLFASFLFKTSKAQTELLFPWTDSRNSRAYTHICDVEGNTYILGTLNSFYSGPGIVIEGDYCYGSTLIKVNKNNNVVWQKNYPIPSAEYLPAWQLFMSNNSIYLPYNSNIGLFMCSKNSAAPTSWNGLLMIDKNSGNVLSDTILSDKVCGELELRSTSFDKNGQVSYLYTKYDTFYLETRDASLKPIRTIHHYWEDNTINISYDTFSAHYFMGDRNGINVYDTLWNHLATFPLPFMDSLPQYGAGFNYAYNDSFVVVNYYAIGHWTWDAAYVAVFTKSGKLISAKKSQSFTRMLISGNDIFCIASPYYGFMTDTNETPVTFLQMDMYQRIKRKKTIGKPFVRAEAITISEDGTVIITGTSYTSNPNNSHKTPDNVYYYKQQLADIPLLTDISEQCGGISIYPNPATNLITVNNYDFDAASNPTLEVYDVLGRQMIKTDWPAISVSLDISSYPAGIYMLRANNNNNSCIYKFQKD